MSNSNTEAGTGEHHVYRIPFEDVEAGPLEPEKHYVGVDAVAWYINKQGSYFSDRIASGTLDITLAGGTEKYQAALGVFELRSGSRTAPVFDHPVLPDRRYRGGAITISAALTSTKSDTALASLLKSASSASLGVVAGIVQTATLATGAATKVLEAAGNELVSGVKRVLADTGKKREALFDFSGLEYSIQPGQKMGRERFILLHRGANLNQDRLALGRDGELLVPTENGSLLMDGAWLLLRLRKSTEYSGFREWFDLAKKWRGKLTALVDDVELGVVTEESALKRLHPSLSGTETLFDEFNQLRTLILNDGVLTELEAAARAGSLRAGLQSAIQAVKKRDASIVRSNLSDLEALLLKGDSIPGETGAAFLDTVAFVSAERTKASTSSREKIAALDGSRDESLMPVAGGTASSHIGQEDWALVPNIIHESLAPPEKTFA